MESLNQINKIWMAGFFQLQLVVTFPLEIPCFDQDTRQTM